jgi:hypothetical protein
MLAANVLMWPGRTDAARETKSDPFSPTAAGMGRRGLPLCSANVRWNDQ